MMLRHRSNNVNELLLESSHLSNQLEYPLKNEYTQNYKSHKVFFFAIPSMF